MSKNVAIRHVQFNVVGEKMTLLTMIISSVAFIHNVSY